MGLLKTAFLISIFWCQIQTAPIAEKECPNEFSYILGDNCYSLHTDLEFNFNDAFEYCKNHSGTLWSKPNEEEIDFLRKVKAKQSFQYWVGAQADEGRQLKYLSDNSLVAQSLVKQQKQGRKINQCLALQYTEQKLAPISCLYTLRTVCEYTGEKCENQKNERKECFEFTITEEDFTTSSKICENIGGRIAEVRNERQLDKLKKTVREDKAFEKIDEDTLNKLDGSFPILWLLDPDPDDENICEIYQNREIQKADCSAGIHNFACKFDAIPKTPEIIADNALPTHTIEEKPTIIMDTGDVPNISTTTTTLIIIMVIMIVILLVAVGFLVYRLYWARNRRNGTQEGEEQPCIAR